MNADTQILQSTFYHNHQTCEMLAELWGVGQATQANTITINGKEAVVVREAAVEKILLPKMARRGAHRRQQAA